MLTDALDAALEAVCRMHPQVQLVQLRDTIMPAVLENFTGGCPDATLALWYRPWAGLG